MCKRIDSGDSRKKIAPRLRHAIYLRDRHTCLYCGRKVEVISGGMWAASLEHLRCWSKHEAFDGSSEDSANLFVTCQSCNSSRNDADLKIWCCEMGHDYSAIRKEIRRRRARKINLRKGSQELKRVSAARKARRAAMAA
jgi:hypothetical protein